MARVNRMRMVLCIAALIGFATAAGPALAWGALAVDGKGRYGFTWGHPDMHTAHVQAATKCGRPDCRVVMDFDHSCAAHAHDSKGTGTYAWAKRADRKSAETRAIAACEARLRQRAHPGHHGSAQCLLKGSACDPLKPGQ